jgi:hypothetical protein
MSQQEGLLAHKIAIQSTKNMLKQLSGIDVLKIYENNENQELNELYLAYCSRYDYNEEPYSQISYDCSEEEIYQWLIDIMELKQEEYFFLCNQLWCKIKMIDLYGAVSSLWKSHKNTKGFLLAEIDLSRIIDCGSDSRDEYNYLIDIWERQK